MAKLEFKTAECEQRVIELKLGVNRLGRGPESDFQLEHQTVSAAHCEVLVGCGQVAVHDCGSTNGTFLDGVMVQDATLRPGQTLRLGDLELRVVDTDIPVTIPKFEVVTPARSPVVLSNGSVLCGRHLSTVAAYRCCHCCELLCTECVHRLRRRGGKILTLCPLCSYPVEPLGPQRKQKKSLFRRLRETTRLLLGRANARN